MDSEPARSDISPNAAAEILVDKEGEAWEEHSSASENEVAEALQCKSANTSDDSDISDSDTKSTGAHGLDPRLEEEDRDDPVTTSVRSFATKHEILEPTVEPVPDIEIDSTEHIELAGEVSSIIDSVVIVQGVKRDQNAPPTDAGQVLDSESLLVFDDRTVFGQIFETFGPTTHPLYSVRFPSEKDIDTVKVVVGRSVFYLPRRSHFAFPRALALLKGSDASNYYDEEAAGDEVEYSDDEAERAAKRRLRGEGRDRNYGESRDAEPTMPNLQHGGDMLPYDDLDPYAADTTAVPTRPSALMNVQDPYDSQAPAECSGSRPVEAMRLDNESHRPRGRVIAGRSRGRGRGRGRASGPGPRGYESRSFSRYREENRNRDRMELWSPQDRGNSHSFDNTQYSGQPSGATGSNVEQLAAQQSAAGFIPPYVAPHVNPRFANALGFDGTFGFLGQSQFTGYPHQALVSPNAPYYTPSWQEQTMMYGQQANPSEGYYNGF